MKANKEKFEPRSTRWKESRDGFEFIRKGAVGDHAAHLAAELLDRRLGLAARQLARRRERKRVVGPEEGGGSRPVGRDHGEPRRHRLRPQVSTNRLRIAPA